MARVVLTQPLPRVASLAARLSERGHEVLMLPFSRLVAAGEEGEATIDTTMRRLAADEFDWVVFVSPASIAIAAPHLPKPWPARTGIAVVGPASRHALDDLGQALAGARIIAPEGPRYDADALVELPALQAPAGLRVLVLRGASGNDGWIERLRQRGAAVEVCALYRREAVEPPAQACAQLAAWLAAVRSGQTGSFPAGPFPAGPFLAGPFIVVTLIETVQRLERCLAQEGRLDQAHAAPVLTIHPRIEQALRAAGWRDVRLLAPGQQTLAAALESA